MSVALFVSGSGSLIPAFVNFAREHEDFEISCIVANRECLALDKAKMLGIDYEIFPECNDDLIQYLENHMVKVICLAGYLKIVPPEFIEKFEGKIINVHPSLIPKYCGMKFHGDKVHQAVLDAGESESGITIHEVIAEVDRGPILRQEACVVLPDDTVDSLRERVQNLEHEWYPKVAYETLKEQVG